MVQVDVVVVVVGHAIYPLEKRTSALLFWAKDNTFVGHFTVRML